MNVIATVLWTFSNLTDGCIAAVYFLLRVNEFLGSIIIGVCFYATTVLRYLVKCLCQAYTELTFFCQDIVSFVGFIVNVTDALVHGSADCVVKTFAALLRLAAFLKTSFANGYYGVASAAYAVVSSCYGFLALLLNSAVLLLQMLPYTAFLFGRYALYGVSVIVRSILTCVTVAVGSVVSAIVTTACVLSQFLFGQPEDVYTGLVILLLTAIILKIAVRARAHQTVWRRLLRLVNAITSRRPQRRRQPSGPRGSPPSPPFTMTLRRSTSLRRDRLNRLEQELEQEREKQLCVVCLNEARSVILLPCRHFALCTQCLGTLFQQQHQTCPMCRHTIYEAIPVYA
ncbi:E3 ubiquitin-protein ligase RNF26-like [Rhipicephalus sanguineus]|uniref:E3 ubiquitin-protein ligase RNF26-like n=1 Tax=Rhipicephalus sanguineus TaxID=34632 RepID=UPI001895773E|nr:E3 ubiquitin-protein ligase RNF26-like [Rhipicephalus sanguineus]